MSQEKPSPNGDPPSRPPQPADPEPQGPPSGPPPPGDPIPKDPPRAWLSRPDQPASSVQTFERICKI